MWKYRTFWLVGSVVFIGLLVNGYRRVADSTFAIHSVAVVDGWTPQFEGVDFLSRRLHDSDEGGGMMYLVRVNLAAAGIDLYMRPFTHDQKHPNDAFYALEYPWRIASEQRLAVTVNAQMFSVTGAEKVSVLGRKIENLFGQTAREAGPIVIDHQVAGGWGHGVFIWFDDDLTPHMQRHSWKSPRKDLTVGKIAVTAWYPLVEQGVIDPNGAPPAAKSQLHARTTLGIDTEHKLLYLACFERASLRFAAEQLQQQGIADAMILDGGGSTCMTIASGAAHGPVGTIIGGLRPVASVFGIRARPLP